MGTRLVSCPGILGMVSRWDRVEVNWNAGLVRNVTTGAALPFESLSLADREMLETGGLVPYLKSQMQNAVR